MPSSKPIYLYVTPFFPSKNYWRGGFCLDAARAIRADGRYRVVVMQEVKNGEFGDTSYDGFDILKIPRKRIGAAEYFESLLLPLNNRLFLKKLKSASIDPKDIAVCHVHDFAHYVQYALALQSANPKIVTLVHHHYSGFYDLSVGKLGIVPVWSDLLYSKMRREFASVDGHVFISEHCRAHLGHVVDFNTGEERGALRMQLRAGGLHREFSIKDSYVLYNPVDNAVFYPQKTNRFEPKQGFTIGCVGNFNPGKAQLDLIRAVEIVRRDRKIQLKLVGNGGAYYKECRKYVSEHGLDDCTEFVAPMPHDQMPNFYRSLDLFVMPSVNEGFCCVNAEAHACGVPVIACRGLPIEELLSKEDQLKWLVPPHDILALADKIKSVMDGQCNQHFIVDLNITKLTKDFLAWVEELRRKKVIDE